MLGLALTGSTLGSSYLDSQITAASELYRHHFFCANCGKLNGTNKQDVTYIRTGCCHCKASLVLHDANYYEVKKGAITSMKFIDRTGVFSGIVLVGEGFASADLASIGEGCLSLATLGISSCKDAKEYKEFLEKFKETQRIGSFIKDIRGQLVKYPPDNQRSAYQLYDDLTDEEFKKIVNSVDCVSTSNTVNTRAVRAGVASTVFVTASVVTVPYDAGKATFAFFAGGIKTIVNGGSMDRNCDDIVDDMGGWTTKKVWNAGQDFVDNG